MWGTTIKRDRAFILIAASFQKKRTLENVLGPENQMLQSCPNTCLEISPLVVGFFWVYSGELSPGRAGWGDWFGALSWWLCSDSGRWPRVRRGSSVTQEPKLLPVVFFHPPPHFLLWLPGALGHLFPLKAVAHSHLILPV